MTQYAGIMKAFIDFSIVNQYASMTIRVPHMHLELPQGSSIRLTLGLFFVQCRKAQVFLFASASSALLQRPHQVWEFAILDRLAAVWVCRQA